MNHKTQIMAKQYKTPGVYVTEKNSFGSSIVQNQTAIPSFIGFTEHAHNSKGKELDLMKDSTIVREPIRVSSLMEYEKAFGDADKTGIIELTEEGAEGKKYYSAVNKKDGKAYTPGFIHPSVSAFFENGGGACHIISLGKYADFNLPEMPATIANEMNFIERAIEATEISTLILPTDLIRFGSKNYYNWGTQLVNFAAQEKQYFTLLDVILKDPINSIFDTEDISNYRNAVSLEFPSYAGAYFPYLKSLTSYAYKADLSNIYLNGNPLNTESSQTKEAAKSFLSTNYINMPPSPFIAGIYARLDYAMGVWTPPANTSLSEVFGPVVNLTSNQQEDLNVDAVTGKSINVIRSFAGKGTLVWGARTNDGNSMDWRYVNVRRLFISMETDISKALETFMFKPNVHNTWVEVKTMIESYLFGLFNQGAFAGTTPEQSYKVLIGVGETMTDEDVLNGYMRVSIMVAPVHPAEFIVLTISQMVGQ